MPAPLVAIVSPIHQGAAQVASCVASVRRQSHCNWVHLLVDNASSDGTSGIADRLAAEDPRVRVLRCDEHVDMLSNWNRALRHVPEAATYVRQLNVDDELEPQCLERSVAAAEAHPDVAIVSSYFLNGARQLPRVRHRRAVRIPGREVVRKLFLGGGDYLAQPSVLLLRRAALRGWPTLYRTTSFPPGLPRCTPLCQADKEGFFATLEHEDLLFVPERLVRLRVDPDSATGYSWRVGAWHAGWLELLLRHGERFLDAREIARAMRRITLKYVRSATWRRLRGRTGAPEFVTFHRHALGHLIPALRARGFEREARMLRLCARFTGAEADADARAGADDRATGDRPTEIGP